MSGVLWASGCPLKIVQKALQYGVSRAAHVIVSSNIALHRNIRTFRASPRARTKSVAFVVIALLAFKYAG